MALTATTLSADLSATGKTATVASTTGFPAVGVYGSRQMMQIDGEYMLVDHVPVSGTVKILMRGYNGTAAVAHDTLAPVLTSSAASDFPIDPIGGVVTRPPYVNAQASYGEDGAISVPNENTQVNLTKATAGAYTLAAPSKGQDGVTLVIVTRTAAAHVITATGLIADGAAGSPEDTATWDAFIGASLTLTAQNGLWAVTAVKGVTIT